MHLTILALSDSQAHHSLPVVRIPHRHERRIRIDRLGAVPRNMYGSWVRLQDIDLYTLVTDLHDSLTVDIGRKAGTSFLHKMLQ